MQLADGLEWKRIYWMRGKPPQRLTHDGARYDVKDPPCLGWQYAFVVPGAKRSIIFCPYSFESFQVRNDCAELVHARESDDFRRDVMVDKMRKNWEEYQSLGFQRDYDTAALVFKRLGETVPEQRMKGGEEDTRSKGGKPAEDELLKPVRRSGKRGKFLQWFLDDDGETGSRSIRECMAEFDMTRSNALSYLFMLNKDHGIGYELVGDNATVILPDGCADPFDGQTPKSSKKEKKTKEPETDDDWLDGGEAVDDDDWLG